MNNNLESLIRWFPFEVTGHHAAQFETYITALLAYNTHTNLTAHRDEATLFEKGILDSLLFPVLSSLVQGRWLDVGSGAGFPGIPLSIVFPQSQWTLLEPIQKKATFLEQMNAHLHVQNHIVVDRAEKFIQHHREHFEGVVSRAVASLPILLELCLPFVKVGGYFLAYKGELVEDEVKLSAQALTRLGGEIERIDHQQLPSDHASRELVIVRKIHPTPLKYPRMFSQIKHSPL